MNFIYRTDLIPATEQVINLYDLAGLPRPTDDFDRISKMLEHSDLIVTAWHAEKLIGVSRTITDWVWTAYLADLAVDPEFKKSGIGKKLVEITRETLGDRSMLILLSVPTAMEYYPKIGFTKEDRAFSINRTK
jgi:ribosomal protein S18 acetylase RimI-like enzyme